MLCTQFPQVVTFCKYGTLFYAIYFLFFFKKKELGLVQYPSG